MARDDVAKVVKLDAANDLALLKAYGRIRKCGTEKFVETAL